MTNPQSPHQGKTAGQIAHAEQVMAATREVVDAMLKGPLPEFKGRTETVVQLGAEDILKGALDLARRIGNPDISAAVIAIAGELLYRHLERAS